MSNIERDECVWFIHGPTGWSKFDREPGYAVRATGKAEILGPLVPAATLRGAVDLLRELADEAAKAVAQPNRFDQQALGQVVARARLYLYLGGQCGRLLVGQGDDTYDPTCALASGHEGQCRP